MKKIIVILGPTATGKTKLAVRLARKFKGEIVSADSRQIYRGMNIGTGKDLKNYELRIKNYELKNKNKTQKIPYRLIDIVNPNTEFNVEKFKKLALKKIYGIIKRGKLPILVGGTGLYISALVDNYDIPKVKPNPKLRQKLAIMSLREKLKKLKALDPAAFEFIDQKNPRRIDRALEICLSGSKFSEIKTKSAPLFDALIIGLNPGKKKLAQKINGRVDKMMKVGLVTETKKLLKKYDTKNTALQTIGYAEIIDYINKKTTLNQAVNLIKLHTRQFAKRQTTWFKRMETVNWIKNETEAEQLIKDFLPYLKDCP
ncbi:tRNA (adenosine(37)-N6)-dimethylallyltransferase MiaA [Candidatus Kuenenbacteria bacterium RIFCSPHIGHO2_12_FULL_42_14]|uniref:tRNA dimethylallyltransferase n=2 Tax=Candidatus Kueneniibacteriota TaxID=1752740 RepID=A0A1F6GK13_9BACT|nr:MAG: tRNA (adenosine(37)-N6)-dimethylallyltransferase MiaA [Candidatus Kuenenbacteria bacterium RIFCSPHIGHO2_02_FULL_42_29]OGG90274.1 MAG: tRNA (adenosine(37)-N6)-dimethylallyltransferase MiaA [Candidatus Kuenenbacteria bacterium RIFCSPLOWO2_02_FULL_42_16]OGG98464.1 MAG: tRNA (adenosine(37)-N6)-dimethylallyltransferase MiaA [Candidatus Kuenenbacteria bacterium RIFCSPHIGHO2_12_FULL_42_14]